MFNILKVWLFRCVYRFMNWRAWRGVELDGLEVSNITVADDIPARDYRGGECALIIYLHGGGWTIGDLDTHDYFCRKLALATSATVISLDYRRAPEHPFPAAVEDCRAATLWLLEHLPDPGLADAPVILAGDSAGGNLAAVTANHMAVERPAHIDGQLLIYPAVRHCQPANASMRENGSGHVLTYSMMKWFWENYLGGRRGSEAGDVDALATPLLHPIPDKTPPALVITAGLDPLRDEGADYARKLADAGVDCVHELFMEEEHGFVCSEGETPAHEQAMQLIVNWLEARSVNR